MSVEGLRAWIGEVERKLEKRTRVFLALTVIAIGIAGASVYLAIDARESSVSESDVQELQQQLEAQIDAAAVGSSTQAEPVEPTEPTPQSGSEEQPKSGQNSKNGTGGVGTGGASAGEANATAPGGAADGARLRELLEQAKEQSAEAAEGAEGK